MVNESLRGSRRYRNRISIIADVLDVAKEGSGKTKIMYRASLSFSQINDYLPFLLDVNLLETIGNPKRRNYKTTNKGLRYLQCYVEIRELLKKEKDNNPNNAAPAWFLNTHSSA